jgi:hypothetical protein
VARIPANPKNAAVLPNSTRRMMSAWVKTAAPQKKGFFGETVNEWNNFGLGKYTATVSATYGSRQTSLQNASVSFWIFPWHLLMMAAILIVLLVVLISVYNKMIIRRAIGRAKGKGQRAGA